MTLVSHGLSIFSFYTTLRLVIILLPTQHSLEAPTASPVGFAPQSRQDVIYVGHVMPSRTTYNLTDNFFHTARLQNGGTAGFKAHLDDCECLLRSTMLIVARIF